MSKKHRAFSTSAYSSLTLQPHHPLACLQTSRAHGSANRPSPSSSTSPPCISSTSSSACPTRCLRGCSRAARRCIPRRLRRHRRRRACGIWSLRSRRCSRLRVAPQGHRRVSSVQLLRMRQPQPQLQRRRRRRQRRLRAVDQRTVIWGMKSKAVRIDKARGRDRDHGGYPEIIGRLEPLVR
jgi:hypothetical protein